MQKLTITYDSHIDALIAISKRLSVYESRYQIVSEDFFDQYSKGKMADDIEFIEWSNDYQHYMAIKLDIERQLRRAAS